MNMHDPMTLGMQIKNLKKRPGGSEIFNKY